MQAKIVNLPTWKPKTFTTAEAMLEEVRILIHKDGRTQREIALNTGVGPSTINHIATGHTKWPRHTTLFPLLEALHKKIQIVDK